MLDFTHQLPHEDACRAGKCVGFGGPMSAQGPGIGVGIIGVGGGGALHEAAPGGLTCEILDGLPNVDTSSFLDSWIEFGLAHAPRTVFPRLVLRGQRTLLAPNAGGSETR